MKLKNYLIALFLAMPFVATAQELIASFEPTNGIIAGDDRRLDYNDKPCALVKIQIVDDIEDVEWALIGDIVDKGTEKWAFMESGCKKMKVIPKNHLPVEIVFADYGVQPLEGNRVYKLVLTEPAPVANDIAAPFLLGVKGGVDFTSAGLDEKGVGTTVNFHVGVDAYFRFTQSIGMSAGLYFAMKGYNQANLDYADKKASASYLELPVLLVYSIKMGRAMRLQLSAGTYIDFGLSGRIKCDHPHVDIPFFNVYKKTDYGLQAGAALLYANHYYVGAYYQNGLGDYKNQDIGITIGYNF